MNWADRFEGVVGCKPALEGGACGGGLKFEGAVEGEFSTFNVGDTSSVGGGLERFGGGMLGF